MWPGKVSREEMGKSHYRGMGETHGKRCEGNDRNMNYVRTSHTKENYEYQRPRVCQTCVSGGPTSKERKDVESELLWRLLSTFLLFLWSY